MPKINFSNNFHYCCLNNFRELLSTCKLSKTSWDFFVINFCFQSLGKTEYWIIRYFLSLCKLQIKPSYLNQNSNNKGMECSSVEKFSICPKVKMKPTARDKIHTSFKQLGRNVQRLSFQSACDLSFSYMWKGSRLN